MMDDETKNAMVKRQVPAVTRAVAILRLLGRSHDPLGVNHIARELGIVPSTCLHILRVLQDEGFVEFERVTKRYTIGIGILPLARFALQNNTFSTLVQPRLAEISGKYGVTSIATQLAEPSQMVVIALAQSDLPFRLQVDLGSRFPILISATGRLFAAFNGMREDKLATEFAKLVWDHPPSFQAWHDEIQQVRAQGYAVDQGTYISGVTVVAVPVFGNNGKMVRSLVALGISERAETNGVHRLAKSLIALRDEIEGLQLGAGN